MLPRLNPRCICWLGLLLWTTPIHGETEGGNSRADSGRHGVTNLAVVDGCCTWVLPAGSPAHVVVVGSLGSSQQSFSVKIRAEATQADPRLPREPLPDNRAALLELSRQAERAARLRQVPEALPPRHDPPRRRVFSIFTADRAMENSDNYTQFVAEICKVGKHVQVYVDCRDPSTAGLTQAVSELIRTFDEEVYPFSQRYLGQAADVDRDGRFTVLFSSWLGRLQGGRVSLDGFVRGSDFLPELGAPFSNRCDMLYMNSRLKAGPQLRTVLAHEFTHAIMFSEHVLHNPAECRHDEESWLNEGLAHLVEDLHEHGWSNLDHRVRAFLSQPHRYPLVVPDYFGSGLWRDPGTRGSAFLFLRWCHLQRGGDLPRRLIQSPFVGVRNIEYAMQRPFAELFRAWAVSMILEDSWRRDLPLQGRVVRLEKASGPALSGPMCQVLGDSPQEFHLPGTGLKYFLVSCQSASNRHFRIQADRDAHLQVTLIRLDQERQAKIAVGPAPVEPGK